MGMYVTVPFEFPHIDYSELNQTLATAGLPECKRASIIVGLGIQWHINHSILSITYNQTSRTPKNDTLDVTVRYRSYGFTYGYNVFRGVRMAVYPFAGIKVTATNYLFNQKLSDSLTTTFNQYLQTPLEHKQINNQLPHLDLGLSVSYRSFCLVDLRAGYLLPLDDATWEMNRSKRLENGPGIRYQYYISVGLGVGAISSEREERRRRAQRAIEMTPPTIL